MPKRIRIQSEHTIHFVTFTVNGYVPIFSNVQAANSLVDVIRYYERALVYKTHAFVVMPEHVHLLLQRLGEKSISAIVRDIKKYYSYLFKTEHWCGTDNRENRFISNGRFTLWHRGFDEVTISSEKQYYTKLNYIIANPVRRGLVRDAEEYLFLYAVGHWRG